MEKYSKQILDALNELIRREQRFEGKLYQLLQINTNLFETNLDRNSQIDKNLGNISKLIGDYTKSTDDTTGVDSVDNSIKFDPITNTLKGLSSQLNEKLEQTFQLDNRRNEILDDINSVLRGGFAALTVTTTMDKSLNSNLNIKSAGNMSTEQILEKLQAVYNKTKTAFKKEPTNTQDISSTDEKTVETTKVVDLGNIGQFIKDFVYGASEFAKNIKGVLEPTDIPIYITRLYKEIAENINQDDIDKTEDILSKVSNVMNNIKDFSEGISFKAYPTLLFAYHLNLGKMMAKIVTQTSKELTKIKPLAEGSSDTISTAMSVTNNIKDFSFEIGKVYLGLLSASVFPIGKLFAFIIKTTVKSLSNITSKVSAEALEYASNGISIINEISNIATSLRESHGKIMGVVLLRIGNRAANMIKSIVNSLSKVKPISKEGLASFEFVKKLIIDDITAISIKSISANLFLTFFSKSGFGKKLSKLFQSIINSTDIIMNNNNIMDNQKREKLYDILTNLSSKLSKFALEMKMVDKHLGTIKNQEKYNQKIEKVQIGLGRITDMLTNVSDNKLIIETASFNLERINGAIRGISTMMMGLVILAPLIPIATIGLTFVITTLNIFKTIGAFSKSIRKGDDALKSIGYSLAIFATSILFFTVAMIKTGPKVLVGLGILALTSYTFFLIGAGAQLIRRAAKAVTWMGVAMTSFALGLYFLGAAVVTNPLGIMGGIALLGISSLTFFIIGKFAKNIAIGSLAVLAMSIGLFFFSGALTTLGLAMKLWDWETTLMSFTLIGGTALLFGLIGEYGKAKILFGSLGVAAMGISLMVFSLGISALGGAMKLWGWEQVGMSLVLIGGIATVYALIGQFGQTALFGSVIVGAIGLSLIAFSIGTLLLGKAISKFDLEQIGMSLALIGGVTTVVGLIGAFGATALFGAVIVTAVGLSLIPLSLGLLALSTVPKFSKSQIESLGNILWELTKGFTALGLASLFILPGTIVAATMGIALISLTGGLKYASSLNWKKIPIDDIKRVVVGLAEAFAAVGAQNAGGTVGTIMKALSFGLLGPNKVADGIKSVLKASKALKSVGEGVKTFSDMTNGLNFSTIKKDGLTVPAPGSIPHKIATVLGMIGKSFSEIGASGNSGFSLMKLAFGNDFKKSDTEVGIKSVLKAGKALTGIAQGIKDFDNMTNSMNFKTIGSDFPARPAPGSIPHKIATILGVINKVFSDIGASGNSGFSVMKLVFGNDFKKSDTEVGIKSVMKAGEALTSVSMGIKNFDAFTKSMNFNPNDENSIQNKITKILTTITAVFAGIAKKRSGGSVGGSFLKMLTGVDIEGNDVQQGIKSVKDVGKTFTDIANGLKTWSDLSAAGIDITKISKSVTSILTSISNVFAQIGKKDKSSIFSEGNVTNGIDAVKGVGKVFSEIANGIKTFADIQKMGFDKNAFDIKAKGSITWNIKNILLMAANVFAQIGKGQEFDTKNVEKGIKALTGVGKELEAISKGVKIFGNIEKEGLSLNKIKYNIKEVVLSISRVFAEIGQNSSDIKKAESGIKAINGVGKELEAISKSLSAYSNLQKNNIDITKLKKNIKELIRTNVDAVAEIGEKYGSSELINKGKTAIKMATEGLNPISSLIEKYNNIKNEDWDRTKQIMSDSIKTPFNIFKEVYDIWSGISNKWDNFIDKVIINIKTQLENLSESYSNINKNFSGVNTSSDGQIKNMLKIYSDSLLTLNNWSISEQSINFLSKTMPIVRKELNQLATYYKSILSHLNTEDISIITSDKFKMMIKDYEYFIKSINNITLSNNFTDIISNKMRIIEDKLIETTGKYRNATGNLTGLVLGEIGPIQLLTSDLNKFIELINNSVIPQEKMQQFSGIIRYLERLAWINDPFKKFADRFKDHVNDIKSYVSEINNIKETPFKQFLDLNSKVIDLVKSDTNKIKDNLTVLYDYLKEIRSLGDQFNSNQQQATQNSSGGWFSNLFNSQSSQQTQTSQSTVNNDRLVQILERIDSKLSSVIEGGALKTTEID